jgi:hypothetical protein
MPEDPDVQEISLDDGEYMDFDGTQHEEIEEL